MPRNYDIVTLKYSNDDDLTGSVIYNGAGNGDDLPVSVKADNLNNILITASSKEKFKTELIYLS
ncbi:MAG: hypothetical protein R2942_16045 [Ignavibacteria bacterium]